MLTGLTFVGKGKALWMLFTLYKWFSTPGIIMMMDTSVPRNRKKVKMRREMVEFLAEGQQPHRRQGADPHRHDTWGKESELSRQHRKGR